MLEIFYLIVWGSGFSFFQTGYDILFALRDRMGFRKLDPTQGHATIATCRPLDRDVTMVIVVIRKTWAAYYSMLHFMILLLILVNRISL